MIVSVYNGEFSCQCDTTHKIKPGHCLTCPCGIDWHNAGLTVWSSKHHLNYPRGDMCSWPYITAPSYWLIQVTRGE